MQLEIQYTRADLAEASQKMDKRGRVKKTRSTLYGWAIFVFLIFAWTMLLNPTGNEWVDHTLPTQNLWTALVPSLTPACMFLLAIAFFSFDNWRRTRKALATDTSPVDQHPLKIGTLLLMLPFLFMIFPSVPAFTINWNPTRSGLMWAGLLPWAFFAIGFAIIGTFNRYLSPLRAFAQRRSMRRPHRLELTTDGVTIDSGFAYHRLQWEAFDRYSETPNLIKLITEDEVTLIIPKRAVPDSDTLDALRALIQTKISKGAFLERQAGFQVLPKPVLQVPVS